MVTTRLAKLSDLAELQEVYVNTIEHHCHRDYTPAQLAAWKTSVQNKTRWQNAIKTQYFMIAEAKNKIIAFGSLKEGNYIDFLYAHKDFIGKGCGSQVYFKLEQESQRQGNVFLYSDVSKTARPFFEKKGFIIEKENFNVINGIEIVNYKMRKNLTP